MIYYSTGKSIYLPKRGKIVETSNQSTIDVLLKKGSIVMSLEELEQENPKELPVEVKEVNINTNSHYNDGSLIEVPKKKKGNPNFGKNKKK